MKSLVYYDLLEAVALFLFCVSSAVVIHHVHAVHFLPYIDKRLLLDISYFMILCTGGIALYEGYLLQAKRK